MTTFSTHVIRWQKSSFSGVDGEDCVELAHHGGRTLIRESDSPGDVLAVLPHSLAFLIRGAKTHSFMPGRE
ncbi:DUF397 domain-containing protein [Streptomyces sp. NPDC001530]|uniref:DUF397 domain-containing protein n=1 Tax=Streptomyces sp. NPDC001530 TaxID=3364582 RepID=UPI0036A9CA51